MPCKNGNPELLEQGGAKRSHDPSHAPPIPQWRIAVFY